MTETAKVGAPKNKKNAPAGEPGNQAEIRRTGADRQMRRDTERVLTVLLALALALLAITAFALARAQQRIRLNEVPQRHARNGFRRDVRQQSRSFARWNQSLKNSPQLQPALLRLSAIISQVNRTQL